MMKNNLCNAYHSSIWLANWRITPFNIIQNKVCRQAGVVAQWWAMLSMQEALESIPSTAAPNKKVGTDLWHSIYKQKTEDHP